MSVPPAMMTGTQGMPTGGGGYTPQYDFSGLTLRPGASNVPVNTAGTSDPSSGGTDWGSILQQIISGGGNVASLINAIQSGNQANTAVSQADPFAPFRPIYGQQLLGLMQNPSSLSTQPGYQFLLDQGVQAIDRSALAPGGTGAGGAEGAALEQYGQGLATSFYNQQTALLAKLAGADITPANAAQALQAKGAAAGSIGTSIAGTASSIGKLVNQLGNLGGGATVPGIDAGSWSDAMSGLDQSTASSVASDSSAITSGIDSSLDSDIANLFGPSAAGGGAAAGATALTASDIAGGATGLSDAAVNASIQAGASMSSADAAFGGASVTSGGGGAAAGGAAAGSLGLGLLGVGAVLAPVLYGMSKPPYENEQAAYSRTASAMAQGFQLGQPGWPVLEGAALNPNAVDQETWDMFAKYGINKSNIMQYYTQYASMPVAGSTPIGQGPHYGSGGV